MNFNSRHLLLASLLILSLIWTESNKSNLVLWFPSPAFPGKSWKTQNGSGSSLRGRLMESGFKIKANWSATLHHQTVLGMQQSIISDLLCVRVYECEFSFKSEQLSRDRCSPYVCGISVSSWLAAVLKDHNKIDEALSSVSAKQKGRYVWIL